MWERAEATRERRKAGEWRSEAPRSSREVRGETGRRRRRREELKSWGRREQSRLDMGLCAVLLICLSQAELGRVWAREHEGKPPVLQVFTCFPILRPDLNSCKQHKTVWVFLALFFSPDDLHACVKPTGPLTFLFSSHRKHMKWIFS